MRWIDTHTHISGVSHDGTVRDNLAGDLAAVLDGAKADLRFVVSTDAGAEYRRMMEQPEGVMEAARFVHNIVEQLPGRLYGAFMPNPHFLDASLKAMDKCFGEWGFIVLGEVLQYKMYFRVDSDPVEELVRKAAEFKVPVQVHISTEDLEQGPFSGGIEELNDFFGLVERAPEMTYILAHLVGGAQGDPPVVDGYLDLIERRMGGWPANFWAEIKDVNSPGVVAALQRIPNDRIMMGTDWVTRPGPPFLPYGMIYDFQSVEANPFAPDIPTMVSLLKAAGASEETARAIGFENAAGLLRLEGTA
jgi:predicted TIM-barrel fold metal-dependent hydrolase